MGAVCNLLIFVRVAEITRVAHPSFVVALVNVRALRVLLLIVITTFVATDAHSFRMVLLFFVRALCYFNKDLTADHWRLCHFLIIHWRIILGLIRQNKGLGQLYQAWFSTKRVISLN